MSFFAHFSTPQLRIEGNVSYLTKLATSSSVIFGFDRMSRCVALQTHLASVIEALVHAAIAEMCKLTDVEALSGLTSDASKDQRKYTETEARMKTEKEEKMVSLHR